MMQAQLKNILWEILKPKTYLTKLIFVNICIYFGLLIIRLFFNLFDFLFQSDALISTYNQIILLLSCPASFEGLLFQPWSIITSIFLHVKFFHFLFNIIILHFAGSIFRSTFTDRQLLSLYFIGGIVGNLIYMGAYNIFPVFEQYLHLTSAMGASGAIMGILFAATVRNPKFEIQLLLIGRIQLVWFALILIGLDLLTIPYNNPGGHIAHIGGALAGVAFALLPSVNWKRKRGPKKAKTRKYAVSSNYEAPNRPISDEEYNAKKIEKEKQIDAILDKISKNGYDGITKEEKEFLFKNKL